MKLKLYRKWGRWLEEDIKLQQVWSAENAPIIDALKAELFAIAGYQVSPEPYPYLSEVVHHGEYIDLPVRFRRMARSRCHDNVSLMWKQRTPRSRLKTIVRGYAMSEDNGTWVPHSWGMTNTYILETALGVDECFDEYFGIIMDGKDADAFVAGDLPETASGYFTAE